MIDQSSVTTNNYFSERRASLAETTKSRSESVILNIRIRGASIWNSKNGGPLLMSKMTKKNYV